MRKAPRWTRFGLATALAIGIGLAPLAAQADDYDQRRSGHPLRVVGYVLHPVGMLIDPLIFRPAH